MENKDLLGDSAKEILTDLTVDHSQEPPQKKATADAGLRRENDSLDDFEHLEHDVSPVKDFTAATETADEKVGQEGSLVISSDSEPPRAVSPQVINTVVGEVVTSAKGLVDDFSSDIKTKITDTMNIASDVIETSGDAIKTDKSAIGDLLGDLSYPPPIPPHAEPLKEPKTITSSFGDFDNFKSATQNFMDTEREPLPVPVPAKIISDLADRFSDSEPEADDFKPSSEYAAKELTTDEFLVKSSDSSKIVETFKDVIEDPEPELPTRDYLVREPSPVSEISIIEAEPEPETVHEVIKESPKLTPEPIVEPVCKLPQKSPATEKKEIIAAEAMFCKMGLDAWFNPERLDPKVESLIYWRDPKKSGGVFGGILVVLLSLAYFSLISVAAYLSLLSLAGTISFRIYKNVLQAVQKTADGHPFKELLDADVTLPQDKVKEITEIAVTHINAAITELRRLFLVEDLVDSIKFGVLLWCLTYVGAWFNGMTLIIIAFVALFTLPKVYENNKTQIDANLDIVRTKLAEITSKVKAAIPIGKKTEEKKEQ